MEILDKIIQIKKSAVAMGFFDGVHAGHRRLIAELVRYARENNSKSVIITFKSSPAECFTQNVKYIRAEKQKKEIISLLGADYMFELDFNEKLMDMRPARYLEEIIYKNFEPIAVITGFNHTFGKDKKGNSAFLKQNEKKFGYKYIEIPPVKIDDELVSSTLIKKYLNEGNIKRANTLLSSEFEITGTVIYGNKTGRTIGFPTANISYPDKIIEIPFGVYSCDVILQNIKYKGIMNYGIKPTVNREIKLPAAEIHIIGFHGNIYGNEIKVYVKNMIRAEKKFNSLDELQNQIIEDIKQC